MSAVLSVLFPKFCCGCGRQGAYMCLQCLAGMDAHALLYNEARVFSQREHIDAQFSSVAYDGVFKRVLKTAKYGGYEKIMEDLSLQLVVRYQDRLDQFMKRCVAVGGNVAIVPVPMHPSKFKMRGFNQTDVIAQVLGERFGLPVRDNLLQRTDIRRPQAALDRKGRLFNARNAFDMSLDKNETVPKACLLVDDVWTTGATAHECSRVLKYYGCESVFVYTLAQRWYNDF